MGEQNSGRGYKKPAVLVTILIVFVGIFVFIFASNEPDVDSKVEADVIEEVVGFKHEPVQFEDFTFELLDSEYGDDLHTFHFNIINTSNSQISVSNADFEIKNGDQLFSPDESYVQSSKLNPGMSTLGAVTFIMNNSELDEGSPYLRVDYGFFLKEIAELELKK